MSGQMIKYESSALKSVELRERPEVVWNFSTGIKGGLMVASN